MQKLKKCLLACVLMLGMSACAKNDVVSNQIKDGIYEGIGSGKGGDIVVEMSIKNDTIEQIDVKEANETPGFETAMDTLSEEILSTNSLDVDIVAGCTLTSKGFLEAMENALKAAGASKDMLKKKEGGETAKKEDVTEEFDVVVVGAGGAGLIAAIEAKTAGANVVIVEKMPFAGGNTLISGAEYAAPLNWVQKDKGIEDSNDLFYEDVLKAGGNPELIRVLADEALNGAVWLRDEIGVVWEDRQMFFGGHSVERSLVPEGASGKEIITKLLKKAEALEIPIYYDTPAKELMMESGKVSGVKAEGKKTNYTLKAKNVILTTGGFGSNVDMRVEYNPEIDGSILSTNTTGSTGDGIVMAQMVGAGLTGMEHIQLYPICDPLTGTLLYVDDARLVGGTILINKEGKRFVEELDTRYVISMAIKAQTDSVTYELWDHAMAVESKILDHHEKEIEYLKENDLLVVADTIEECAEFFGIDAAELRKTVDQFNQYVKDGKDLDFNKRGTLYTIEEGPFYIVKAVPAVHHTMGGVTINTQAQVLDTKGEVIEGLYAAGEVTGDIHGNNRLGSAAIADITVFGRIAGQNAAK